MQKLHYIKLFTDLRGVFHAMTDDEAGRLFKALFDYANGDDPQLEGAERYVYMMLCLQLDRDAASYEELSARNTENGKRGGRPKNCETENRTVLEKTERFPKKPNGYFENQSVLKKSEWLEDKDKDKDKDNNNNNNNNGGSSARTREETPPPGNDVPPGVVAYIDANIGNLTAGNYNELAALMDEGITDDLVRYAVDKAVKCGARNAGYVFRILERMRDEGIRSVGDAKREDDEFRRKRDAQKNGGHPPDRSGNVFMRLIEDGAFDD